MGWLIIAVVGHFSLLSVTDKSRLTPAARLVSAWRMTGVERPLVLLEYTLGRRTGLERAKLWQGRERPGQS